MSESKLTIFINRTGTLISYLQEGKENDKQSNAYQLENVFSAFFRTCPLDIPVTGDNHLQPQKRIHLHGLWYLR